MAKTLKKPEKLWAVFYDNGRIDLYSVRYTRRAAIAAFIEGPGVPEWDHWRKRGCYAASFTVAKGANNG